MEESDSDCNIYTLADLPIANNTGAHQSQCSIQLGPRLVELSLQDVGPLEASCGCAHHQSKSLDCFLQNN